jgi:hypothetical protein
VDLWAELKFEEHLIAAIVDSGDGPAKNVGMKVRATSLALGAALAVLIVRAPVARAVPQEDQVRFEPIHQVSGTCEMEIAPDQAVILGGVSSSALKPTEAIEQLDKQLGLMRSYVAEKHGELELLERVRTVKNPQPGKEPNEPPVQVIQRMQATFPAGAPVDAILEKLIELGMDRFGENVLNDYSNRRQAVIHYRVSGFEAKMNDFQQRCTEQAWKQWCNSPQATKACAKGAPPADLELQGFYVRSKETLMRPDGANTPWQWNVNRTQRAQPPADLLGNVTVHLEGNINFTYRAEDEKP